LKVPRPHRPIGLVTRVGGEDSSHDAPTGPGAYCGGRSRTLLLPPFLVPENNGEEGLGAARIAAFLGLDQPTVKTKEKSPVTLTHLQSSDVSSTAAGPIGSSSHFVATRRELWRSDSRPTE
jgi:hypothetical protein